MRIAIDDFGIGYSSLAVLKEMHVDTLKLDRQFVMGVAFDTTSANIVRSVMGLPEELNLTVVAEGIETLAQGYNFSRPVPADEVSGLIGLDFLEMSSRRQPFSRFLNRYT